MKGFPDVPVVWLSISLVLIWLLDRFLPQLKLGFPMQSAIGWICIIVSFALILWSAIWFRKKRTSIEPNDTATTLLFEGPYKISRNPIYLALVIIVLGSVLGRGTVLGLPVLFIFAWVLQVRFIVPEEQGLRDAFGSEAEAYFKKTRRWV